MLREFLNPIQHPDEPQRRVFDDEYFDLYVWYNEDNKIIGFQLCYDKEGRERAFTYINRNYKHTGIDDGESLLSRSAVLISDGSLDKSNLLLRFEESAANIEVEIKEYIAHKIEEYGII